MANENPYAAPQAPAIKLIQNNLLILVICSSSFCISLVLIGVTWLLSGGHEFLKEQLTQPYRVNGLAALVPNFCLMIYGGLALNALLMLFVIWHIVKARKV